jgi:hypothetical protein
MYQGIKITKKPSGPLALDDLNLAELQLGFSLPPSYKEFVNKFGEGLLADFFRIPSIKTKGADLVVWNKRLKKQIKEAVGDKLWEMAEVPPKKKWILSLEPFADTTNGDILCWDIDTKDKAGEYAVFLLDNGYSCYPKVSTSFQEFVDEFCLNQKIDKIYPVGNGKKWGLPPTFEPW